MILSTNQRRGCVARISRDPFRRLVSFSVPQGRSPENEAGTGTAKSGSRPLLEVETRPDPHLCDPIRSAPCSGNAPLITHVTPWPTSHEAGLNLHSSLIGVVNYVNKVAPLFPYNVHSTLWHNNVHNVFATDCTALSAVILFCIGRPRYFSLHIYVQING